MALANTTVYQVDSATGDDANNAGAFNPARAGAGTDSSLAAPTAFADLAVDATLNTKVTSTTIGFGSAHVGNHLRITAGVGFTVGLYEVVSVAAGAATLDRSPAAVGTTGGTGRLGGALASIGQVGAANAGGTTYLKRNATTAYVLSATANVAGGKYSASGGPMTLIGYDTNRTPYNADTRPVLQPGANSVTCFDANVNPCALLNLDFQNPSAFTGAAAFTNNAASGHYLANLRSVGLTGTVIQAGTGSLVLGCEVAGAAASTSAAGGITGGSNTLIAYSTCRSGGGFAGNSTSNNPSTALGCVAYNVTTTSAGTSGAFAGFNRIINCVAHTVAGTSPGGSGFNLQTGSFNQAINCVAVGCASFGFTGVAGALNRLIDCATYNDTGGAVNATAFPTANQVGMVTLTGDPFTNAAGLDFTPNATAGAGARLRAAGYPATLPGLAGTGYPDVGVLQHADPAASGGAVSIGSGGY